MSISTAILASAPQVYWKLDDPTGPAASDSSGHGRAGAYGGLFQLGKEGPEDGTFALANMGGSNTVPSCAVVTPVLVLPWTLEIWAAYPATPQSGCVIIYNGATSARGGGIEFTTGQGSANQVSQLLGGIGVGASGLYVYDSLWHHLVYQQKVGNAVEVWLDGVQFAAGSAAPNAIVGTDKFQLGSGTEPCLLAHAALYSVTLTAGTIATHFAARSNAVPPVFPTDRPVTLSTTDTAKLDEILAAVKHTF
jgi:trimeric autotransporter adhesin